MLEVFGPFSFGDEECCSLIQWNCHFPMLADGWMLINEEREFFGQAELRNSAQICPGLLCNKSDRLDYTEEEIEL